MSIVLLFHTQSVTGKVLFLLNYWYLRSWYIFTSGLRGVKESENTTVSYKWHLMPLAHFCMYDSFQNITPKLDFNLTGAWSLNQKRMSTFWTRTCFIQKLPKYYLHRQNLGRNLMIFGKSVRPLLFWGIG